MFKMGCQSISPVFGGLAWLNNGFRDHNWKQFLLRFFSLWRLARVKAIWQLCYFCYWIWFSENGSGTSCLLLILFLDKLKEESWATVANVSLKMQTRILFDKLKCNSITWSLTLIFTGIGVRTYITFYACL